MEEATLTLPPAVTDYPVLSEEHQWCLINCHSYEKYYFFRTCYERGKCPLCELPQHVYPVLTDESGRNYSNNHWTVVVDTLAEPEYRAQTLLIVFNEHKDSSESNSIYAAVDKARMKDRIERYLHRRFGDVHGTWGSYVGKGKHTIDPVLVHSYETFLIPDEMGEVRFPAYKSPARLREITERALGFATRYENGEIPNRFQAAS